MIFSVPSKTFLIGEYVALNKGPGVLIQTEPRFQLVFQKKNFENYLSCKNSSNDSNSEHSHEREISNFFYSSKEKPYSYFLSQILKLSETHPIVLFLTLEFSGKDKGWALFFLKSCQFLHFYDPHESKGGFGRSSAEYLLYYLFYQVLKKIFFEHNGNINTVSDSLFGKLFEDCVKTEKKELNFWKTFIKLKTQGSGYDLIGQFFGSLTIFDGEHSKTIQWPFDEMSFVVIKTGHKVITYQHLQDMLGFCTQGIEVLKPFVSKVVEGLETKNWSSFCEGIDGFYYQLVQEGLVTEKSEHMVKYIRQCSKVQAVKSCGALGADTILVFYKKNDIKEVHEWLRGTTPEKTWFTSCLSQGIQVETGNQFLDGKLLSNC